MDHTTTGKPISIADHLKGGGLSISPSLGPSSSDALLTPEATARRLGCAVKTLSKMRMAGTGPNFVKVGKLCRYTESAVAEWIAARTRTSTLEAR